VARRPPNSSTRQNIFAITGGAGRFADATGSGIFTGYGEGADKDFVSYQGVVVLPRK
jgi:hypothetical protein